MVVMGSKVKAIQHILNENGIDLGELKALSKMKAENMQENATSLESAATQEMDAAHRSYNEGVARLRQERDAVIAIAGSKAKEAIILKKGAANIHASVKRIG